MPEPPFPQDEEVSPSNPFLEEEEASRRDARPLERALDMLMVTTSRRCPRELESCDITPFAAGQSKIYIRPFVLCVCVQTCLISLTCEEKWQSSASSRLCTDLGKTSLAHSTSPRETFPACRCVCSS